jgi:asparagine synthase (glutamine-hydrolysing)
VSTDTSGTSSWPRFPNPLGLTELDIAYGAALGTHEMPPPPPTAFSSPIAAFEAAMLDAVTRPPCVVLFSGGRDSSAVLAVATRVARSVGAPDPLPVSVIFNADEAAEESEWQELAIRHLGINEWMRVPVDTELDLLGSRAQRILNKHGLLYPAHVNLYDLGLEHARSGSLLSGLHGDGLFTPRANMERVRSVLYRRERPSTRDLLRVGLSLSPHWIRDAVWKRRAASRTPQWVGGAEASALQSRITEMQATQPRDWRQSVARMAEGRGGALSKRSIQLIADEHQALYSAPIGDPGFVAALGRLGGRAGFRSRTEVMERVFGEELPQALLERRSKARFRWSYWGPAAARFAVEWDGSGLPPSIDAEQLRSTWIQLTDRNASLPPFAGLAALPLHAAWLSGRSR